MNTIEQAEARAAEMRARWAGDVALTPRGKAVVALLRLTRELNATDCAAALAFIAEELSVLPRSCGFEDGADA
jgi:hypothetical protein